MRKPPAPTWVVSPEGGADTRPTYGVMEGRLVPGDERVPVGRLCDCSKESGRVIVEQTVYCRVAGTQVAVCAPLP